ncbi:MAG: lysophospholipase [Candidatus Binatia bacterium]|nr:lysophospholipase [Candidatus Binatia bacterium]
MSRACGWASCRWRDLRWTLCWWGVGGALALTLACGATQAKKPFSDPRLYADPPPPAQVPATLSVPTAGAADWAVTVAERAIAGTSGLVESVWTRARPPYGQYDYIAVHRIVSRALLQSPNRPVFFFLPGAHMHGEVIIPDPRYDLRLYLAHCGIDTWTLDYRTHFVPREQIFDSHFMQSWTVEAFVEDAAVAADFVRRTSGIQEIFVGGYSRGATFAALMAARYGRGDILGLVLLDGYVLDPPDEEPLYRERPETPTWFADDLERRYVPYRRWIKMLQDTLADPDGPDFLPVHVFANRAEALAHFLYVSPMFGAQGGLSNAKGGYADVLVLARIFLHEDRYWPRVQNHGGFSLKRHLAGVAFDYEKAFTQLNVPILAFASGNMNKAGIPWAERVEYTARGTAAKETEFHLLEDWGHLDVMFGTAAAQKVFQPICEWIVGKSLHP